MTNGTSQGLYIIVAVVIFGIFTLISYLIFQSSLTPKLTNIFETSLDNSYNYLEPFQKYPYYSNPVSINKVYNFKNDVDKNEVSFTVRDTAGYIRKKKAVSEEMVEIPFGYKVIFEMEVLSEEATLIRVDINNYLKESYKNYNMSGENDFHSQGIGIKNDIPKNKLYTLQFSYENKGLGVLKNEGKESICDFSSLSIYPLSSLEEYKVLIKNPRYKIVKIA